jgi:hypothetical protein
MHCIVKKTVEQIINSGNDYRIAVQANQPKLLEHLHQQFEQQVADSVDTKMEQTQNRQTQRTVSVLNPVDGIDPAWCRVNRTLLLRLSQPVQGIRPTFLSEETFHVLNRLRGFRHFIRYGYGTEIAISQLRINLELAIRVKALITQDLQLFLERLGSEEKRDRE